MMEQYIDSLLWLDTAVWRQIGTTQQLHRSLRAGELTGGLCPMSLLREMLRHAATHSLRSLPLNWYYENIEVIPLMITDGLMTFQVTLPYTNDQLYQRYNIQTFAVPLDDTGSRARVQVQDDIAVDTSNGYWFAPTMCTGRRPQLCHAGPRWRDTFPCEHGLITGHEPDREQCVLISAQTNTTTVQELLEGVFMLQTLGENVRLACKGRRQEQTTLSRGVYKLRLEEGCVLSGGRWALHGMVRRYLTGTTHTNEIAIPPLDLAALMPKEVPDNNTYQTHLDLTNEQYKPNYLSMEDNDGYPELIVAHHLSWMAIILIVSLIILCIIGGVWLYRRRLKIKFFFADPLLAKLGAKRECKKVTNSAKAPESVEVGETNDHDGKDTDIQPIV